MFYFKEFVSRFRYVILAFFLTVFILYDYKHLLLIIISSSLLKLTNTGLYDISNFICTHPVELFKTHAFLIFYFSILLLLPYFFWHFLDFFCSGFYKKEYDILSNSIRFFFIVYFIVNLLAFFFLLPNLWFFFQKFDTYLNVLQIFEFSFQPRLEEYFSFILDFIYLINLFIFFYILICIFIFLLGTKLFLSWRKFFIVINIIFATLLSPPDILSQLFILFLLTLLNEITKLLSIYYLKSYKYIVKNNKVPY